MTYLLDTDTLIYLIRGLKVTPARSQRERELNRRAEAIVTRCRECGNRGDAIALSTITVGELEYGIRSGARDYDAERSALKKVLAPLVILSFDDECAYRYGIVRRELEDAGVPIGAMDMLIAAHGLAIGAVVVTNNQKHFGRVTGLKVESWCA